MLRKLIKENKLNINEEQIFLLEKFMKSVIETNTKFNLTAILNEESFIKKHIIDSLLFFKFNEWNFKTVADIGTGAGIPGVILAIIKPSTHFTLIDSNSKKVTFINDFIKENKLENIIAIKARAEELELEFDLVTSRAVSLTPMMLEISSHLVKVGGKIILYKGRNLKKELCEKIEGVIPELGLQLEGIKEYKLEDEGLRNFIEYKKISKNKKGYPRLFKDIKAKSICS